MLLILTVSNPLTNKKSEGYLGLRKIILMFGRKRGCAVFHNEGFKEKVVISSWLDGKHDSFPSPPTKKDRPKLLRIVEIYLFQELY
jgi:hypothetical protein